MLRYKRKPLIIAFLLANVIVITGAFPFYVSTYHEIVGKTELLYVYIRYTIKLVYLILLLCFMLDHVLEFAFFAFRNYSLRRMVISLGGRAAAMIGILLIIFYFYDYNYLAFMQKFILESSVEYFYWAVILISLFAVFCDRNYINAYIDL